MNEVAVRDIVNYAVERNLSRAQSQKELQLPVLTY